MTEAEYGRAWAAMAKREGHQPALPTMHNDSAGKPGPLAERAHAIKVLIGERGPMTRPEMADALGLEMHQIMDALRFKSRSVGICKLDRKQGAFAVYGLEEVDA